MFSFRRRNTGHLGAADTDGHHRRRYGHLIRARGGDLARDEAENALDNIERRGAFVGSRIEHQFVQHHAAIAAQRKRGVIDKHQADGAVTGGLQDIALEHRIADPQGNPGAIGTGREHVALGHFDLPDGLDIAGGSLGVLAGEFRPRQGLGQIAADAGAEFREQIRRGVPRKEIPNQHLGAVGTDQQKIGAFANVVGGQKKIAARDN